MTRRSHVKMVVLHLLTGLKFHTLLSLTVLGSINSNPTFRDASVCWQLHVIFAMLTFRVYILTHFSSFCRRSVLAYHFCSTYRPQYDCYMAFKVKTCAASSEEKQCQEKWAADRRARADNLLRIVTVTDTFSNSTWAAGIHNCRQNKWKLSAWTHLVVTHR